MYCQSTDFGNDFLDVTAKGQATKAKINNKDYIKLKSYAWQRKPSRKLKGSLTDSEKIYVNHISHKNLISKTCKQLTQLNSKKTSNLIKNEQGA